MSPPPAQPSSGRERLRAFLGVWAPLLVALLLVVVAVNFYLRADLGALEGWRSFCTAGVLFTGAVLILSTFGRYRKVRAARRGT